MPTFTAITLDRFLEPGGPKSFATKPTDFKLEKRDVSALEKKSNQPQISSLPYTTIPETTPMPDCPFSLPPSPYIIHHKRRGPNLQKSFSQGEVSLNKPIAEEEEEEEKVDQNGGSFDGKAVDSVVESVLCNGNTSEEVVANGFNNEKSSLYDGLGETSALAMRITSDNMETESVFEDFFDLQESLSVISNGENEDTSGVDRFLTPFKLNTPMGEYFDASEELSSGSGRQFSLRDFETELREIRLHLLMEIERRKQAEEAFSSLEKQWDRLGQHLSLVGLTLPASSTVAAEDEKLEFSPAEDLCRQVDLARVVSNAVGRGSAKAEVEMEVESQIESKNFEIARLADRLHYYETVNHEMSQRNQEVVEMARQKRQRRKRRQRWMWSSVGLAVTLGSAALAWSYRSTSGGSSSTNPSHCPEQGDSTKS